MRVLAIVAVLILIFDQASKFYVVDALNLREVGRIDVMPPYLTFVMAWNQGINFGLGASGADWMRWLLIAVAVVISVAVGIWAMRRDEFWFHLGAGLVIGGAIGNVIDRIRFGAVADFLNMSCCGINNPYAFNVADISIFAGAFLLIIVGGDKKADN